MSIDSASSIISIPEGALFATVNSYQICELDKDKFTVIMKIHKIITNNKFFFFFCFRYLS